MEAADETNRLDPHITPSLIALACGVVLLVIFMASFAAMHYVLPAAPETTPSTTLGHE